MMPVKTGCTFFVLSAVAIIISFEVFNRVLVTPSKGSRLKMLTQFFRDKRIAPKYNTTLTSSTRVASSNVTTASPLICQTMTCYVTWSDWLYNGRLGNQMFDFAVVVYVAGRTGRRIVEKSSNLNSTLSQVFELSSVKRVNGSELCPCHQFGESRALSFDSRVDSLGSVTDKSSSARTILLQGYFQSWKYTRLVEHALRKYFRFKPAIWRFAQDFLESIRPVGWSRRGYIRVAIHVRRGDVLKPHLADFGYTTPEADYFQRAMRHFVKNYSSRVQFIALSDDMNWTSHHVFYNETEILKKDGSGKMVKENFFNVTYSFENTPGQAMAIMANCDHVIMSAGTFGWWGAWLSNGTTVYYKNWPRQGSSLFHMFTREDFYPPSWIGM